MTFIPQNNDINCFVPCEQSKIESGLCHCNNTVTDISYNTKSVFWEPTSLIRWKRVEIDNLRYNKVLQQLWKGDQGEQEWRDVPEQE
jgi:hypothetical protein